MREYRLYVNPKNLRNLYDDIWSENHIDAQLFENGQKHSVQFSFRGHQMRRLLKKSYNILFMNPWYKEEVHEIHLNAEYKDPSLIRNKLSMDFFHDIGVLAPKTEHILLYLNGTCKGIYLQLESIDQDSLRKRKLPFGPIFYATDNDANFSLLTAEGGVKPSLHQGYTKKVEMEGDDAYLNELMITINTLTNEEFDKKISDLLDVNKYLKWLAGAVCTHNFDGFVHNYALYRNSETGLFEISPWDYDGTWGRDIHGEPLSMEYVPIQGYNTLTARLLECEKHRRKYQQILSSILINEFTLKHLSPIIENLFHNLRPYINKDPYIKRKAENFNKEFEFILNFIQERNDYLKEHLSLLD